MIEGRIKSLFVDLLLLIHTGLNLQTIIAIYGKKDAQFVIEWLE